LHKKLTDTVVHKHINTPAILGDSILTGFDVRIYTLARPASSSNHRQIGRSFDCFHPDHYSKSTMHTPSAKSGDFMLRLKAGSISQESVEVRE
jgi:hypothetical protein